MRQSPEPDFDAANAITQINAVIASGCLPEIALKSASQLVKRLNRPVRIAILGLPGAGKSQLLNFLAGDCVIPEGFDLKSVQLKYGPKLQVKYTLSDGSMLSADQFDTAEITKLAPIFINLEMPLPALRKTSMLEVVAGSSATEQQQAMAWGARNADIALWCTQAFTQTERDLWRKMPDGLKKQSFMVVTKADELIQQGELSKRLMDFRHVAVDQFRGIFPIETSNAIDALSANGTVDMGRLVASGARALISGILREIKHCNQVALDNARILIKEYDAKATDIKKPAAKTKKASKPAAPKNNVVKFSPVERSLCTDIITHLTKQASDLVKQLKDLGSDAPETVMAECLETAEWLTEQLLAQPSDHPDILYAMNTCQDAADLMMLMQLEEQDSSVVDAVILLLQIKRYFEAKVAA